MRTHYEWGGYQRGPAGKTRILPTAPLPGMFGNAMNWESRIDILVMLAGIAAMPFVLRYNQRFRIPVHVPPTEPPEDGVLPYPRTPRNKAEEQLHDLEFDYIGEFDASPGLKTKARLFYYLSPDRFFSACVIAFKAPAREVIVVEFLTRLSPIGSILTGDGTDANLFTREPGEVVVKAPWKKSVRDLYDLHRLLCMAATQEKYKLQQVNARTAVDDFVAEFIKDYDRQVQAGYMRKINDKTYGSTFKGSLHAIPRVLLKLATGWVRLVVPPPDEAICEKVVTQLRNTPR